MIMISFAAFQVYVLFQEWRACSRGENVSLLDREA